PQDEILVERVPAGVHLNTARAVDGERLANLLGVGVDADFDERAVVKVERQVKVLIERLEASAIAPSERVELPVRPDLANPQRRHPWLANRVARVEQRVVHASARDESHLVGESLTDCVVRAAELPNA